MWLSGLHIPETYLAALVQMACRKNNWPLDRSVIYTAVTKYVTADQVEERPEEVISIQNIILNTYFYFFFIRNQTIIYKKKKKKLKSVFVFAVYKK